jgi:hypothetical protein
LFSDTCAATMSRIKSDGAAGFALAGDSGSLVCIVIFERRVAGSMEDVECGESG